jgi:hypothetical protein
VAEPGTTQLRKVHSVPPTRFAGLRGGPATPAASPMPHGDLTAAGAEQIQQVVRDVWPGGPDVVRRRAAAPGSCWNTWPTSPGLPGNSVGRPAA